MQAAAHGTPKGAAATSQTVSAIHKRASRVFAAASTTGAAEVAGLPAATLRLCCWATRTLGAYGASD